jgi:hypothetical protein
MLLVSASILIAFLGGYAKPTKTAWLVLFLIPLLGPGGLYIGVGTVLPLTAYRIGFFALMGILFRLRLNIIDLIKKNKYLNLIIIYFFIRVILLFLDSPIDALFTMLPIYFLAIYIPLIIIRSERDLYKLVNIFVLQAFIISIFVLIEYYTSFSLPAFIRGMSGLDISELQTKGGNEIIRSGYYRVAGLHGNPVNTAYHLTFFLPLVVFYWINKKSKRSSFFVLIVLVAILLLQTRASIVTIFVAIFLIIGISIKQKIETRTLFKIITLLVYSIIGLVFISFLVPEILKIVETFFSQLVDAIAFRTNVSKEVDITGKVDRIPIAIDLFLVSPIYGYIKSPLYAYIELMDYEDLPSLILHLLGGGILLGSLFLMVIFKLVFGTYNEIRNTYNTNTKELIIYSTVAIFSGFLVNFSNFIESHYISLFILYIAIRRYKIIEKTTNYKIKSEAIKVKI